LEELQHILIGKRTVEFDGVAHGGANDEGTNCQTDCSDKENQMLVKKSSDIGVRKELEGEHEAEIKIELIDYLF
jgi:hypothetical protein